MLILTACGGDGGAGTPSPVSGTLAYVETECRGSVTEAFVEHQALRIRQGDREPVTVFETPEVGPLADMPTLCFKRILRSRAYRGKHVILIHGKVYAAASGAQVTRLFDQVVKEFPGETPTLAYIPEADTPLSVF